MPAKRPSSSVSDPAAIAAALMLRLGVATLAVGLPVAGLLSRRGVVLLLPLGLVLTLVAWALDRDNRAARLGGERLGTSAVVSALVCGLAWAVLSRVWSAAPEGSLDRLLSFVGTLALAVAGFLSLPARMRAANLYLVPIGTAGAAALALALALLPVPGWLGPDADDRSFERGLAVVALYLWPSVAWLRSRERDGEALGLAVLAAAAAAVGSGPATAALALGALAFGAASLAPRAATRALGFLFAAVVLAGPVLPYLTLAGLDRLGPGPAAFLGISGVLGDWWTVTAGEPRRLLTGYGLGSFSVARITGLLPPGTPDTPLVGIWYDFGLVGALSTAIALAAGLWGIGTAAPPLRPGLAGAVTTAFALAAVGIGNGQAWWASALAALALVFVAVERGQFRTRLPRAARGRIPAVA